MQMQFVTLNIGEYHFGIDVANIREINRSTDITSVDLAPVFVTGLMNLRGQIITILDPGVKLGLPKRKCSEQSRYVVLKSHTQQEISNHGQKPIASSGSNKESKENIALLVDGVGDIVSVNNDTIEPSPPNIGDVDGSFISGIIKLDVMLLIILKISPIISNNQLLPKGTEKKL